MTARGFGDPLAAQHARDLVHAGGVPERGHGGARGAAGDPLLDQQMVPRFIGFPDNRDFFYLMRREERP